MNKLLNSIKIHKSDVEPLPYAVYSSVFEQRLLNVPIVKPMLIAVLSGDKQLDGEQQLTCSAGQFVFLSNSPTTSMRNIPIGSQYCALLIEFEISDFEGIKLNQTQSYGLCFGEICSRLSACLAQFVEWAHIAPPAMWAMRRKEIVHLLFQLGHSNIAGLVHSHSLSNQIHLVIANDQELDVTIESLCQRFAMSESTLRRKLKAEGITLQDIKDQVRLGQGLHLLQSTRKSIGMIANVCGYQSQSRFSERFKYRFGLTPSQLRKTQMAVSGENLTV
ncbi:helix-turn-helix transcriptional regulator [Pseudoalteromonas tunicata]|jgi:AraC-like DNA-binding protein|uniref:AraC-type DNA-binding domain-containing protein n=1 Tax=Pseudoalteromonas tunicata D2 TaxID=87626 RepID=A4C5C3_9GAMM|nr:helix-turn-helix transcriptional regulator [Pseudoalteromonas tunicata]ATC96772.1 hypothetical protein PTUN_b0374 [Pseudoalteromonas tunicata]AXT32920.1 AraC family transcriptional regulator [Pseudoalteromonas tunicata]EAR30755.1 AraC-type DNA-binding domain-containing protein [Pseudoalteromonas tunicata D2]MDP4984325.1 helix-turn-helix transcriptional regulator [Pseudoalteromonas tunicata]MDP5214711.1 helix-turn-helix transcriptional regulator [Pseudoalteromonas tunicata]